MVSPGRLVRPERRGLLPDLADRARRAPGRGGGAAARRAWGAECTTAAWSRCRARSSSRMLEEVRDPEPPIRLSALFYEPGPAGAGGRRAARGSATWWWALGTGRARRWRSMLDAGRCSDGRGRASVGPRGRRTPTRPLFETNPDRVFCALQGRRLPGQAPPVRHPAADRGAGDDHVVDEGGDLWHRRIEEIDALACALCAHRYAVGHACWLGTREGVVVLPGTSLPQRVLDPRRDAAGRAASAAQPVS